MTNPKHIGEELAAGLSEDLRERLAQDPFQTIPEAFSLDVVPVPPGAGDGECSCDGMLDSTGRRILVAETPFSRRSLFTVLHEVGHHLLWGSEDLLSAVYSLDPGGQGRLPEERVCDALAAAILVPEGLTKQLVSEGDITADTFVKLFDRSMGSREACAVRLAQQLRCDGHVMLAKPDGTAVFTASVGSYPVAREVLQGDRHITVAAGRRGHARWETYVRYRSGRERPMWGDALLHERFVFAILAESPQWSVDGLTVHHNARDRAAPVEYQCERCGEDFETFDRPCRKCEVPTCPACGRCSCEPTGAEKFCKLCGLLHPATSFPAGSEVCEECGGGSR